MAVRRHDTAGDFFVEKIDRGKISSAANLDFIFKPEKLEIQAAAIRP